MEKWESNRIERLEDRIAQLEWKNQERSMFWLRVTMYGLTAAYMALVAIAIALNASNS